MALCPVLGPWFRSRVATPSLPSSPPIRGDCFLRFVGFRDRTSCRVLIDRQLRDAGSTLLYPLQFLSLWRAADEEEHEEVTFPERRHLGTNGWMSRRHCHVLSGRSECQLPLLTAAIHSIDALNSPQSALGRTD